MAVKWAEGLECSLADDTTVQLDGSVVRFVPSTDGRLGVVAVDLYAAPGLPKSFSEIELVGVRWRLVDRPGAPSTPDARLKLKSSL